MAQVPSFDRDASSDELDRHFDTLSGVSGLRSKRRQMLKMSAFIWAAFMVVSWTSLFTGVFQFPLVAAATAFDMPFLASYARRWGLEMDAQASAASAAYFIVYFVFILTLILAPIARYGRSMGLSNIFRTDMGMGVKNAGWIFWGLLAFALFVGVGSIWMGMPGRGGWRESSLMALANGNILAHSITAGFLAWVSISVLMAACIER